jgi:hypothetical protein
MIPRRPSGGETARGNAYLSPGAHSPRSTELDIVEHWINPNRDGALVGRVSVRLRKFIHHDCSVTRTKYGFFVHLPSMPIVDRDGNVLKDGTTGKWKYKPAVEAIDKAAASAFSTAVIEIIKRRFPAMLEGGAG